MGLFNQFPFTNFHELNLDWLINTVKNEESQTAENTENIDSMKIDIANNTKNININTQNINSNTNRIETLEQSASNIPPNAINVRNFGAVGDAQYFKMPENKYYKNINWEPCHDDTAAIDEAIAYALEHNIDTLYFPDGAYLYKKAITLDISKMRFVGENNSAIVSEGLTGGSFITLTSPIQLRQYDFSKCPLENINIWGSYYNGTTQNDVTGISYSNNLVPCHLILKNVSVVHFNKGLSGAEFYKTGLINVSVIACKIGLNLQSSTAVPLYFTNCFFECCETAIYCTIGGYNQLNFVNCAFEYNRRAIYGNGFMNFIACRFEYDNQSAIDPEDYSDMLMFQWGQDSTTTSMLNFESCQFLDLHNYAGNVRDWIYNPVIKADRNANIFYINGTHGIHFNMCAFSIESFPTSNFYITGTGVAFTNCKVTGLKDVFVNPSAKVDSTDITFPT